MAKKKLTKDEISAKKIKTALKNKIISTFKNAEFEYLSTGNINLMVGTKKGDIDLAFLYKNILLICEHTITNDKHIKDHLSKTKIFYDEILKDFSKNNTVLLKLKEKFPDKFNIFDNYRDNQYQVKYLYFYKGEISINTDFMDYIKIVDDDTLEYLSKINKIVRYSSRNEIFRFLDIDITKIGLPTSDSSSTTIDTAVIAPEEVSGLKDMQTVSFLMKAEDLMECGYVLRKDNWEDSAGLYQRLLIKNKIDKIREYLIKEKRGFINNVIVSLPSSVSFSKNDSVVNPSGLSNISNLKMHLPKKINSIGIIDGQHRVYAHYKSELKNECIISNLRKKLHILVTGLVYKDGISESEKIKIESKLFSEINSNATKVSADVLLSIEAIQNPDSNLSIARSVLVELNKTDLFFNKFEMTTLSKSQIKSTSVIKFALSKLVEVDKDKETFFKYMSFSGKDVLFNKPDGSIEYENARKAYIKECSKLLEIYFKVIKNNFKEAWDNPKTHKLFSTTSVNGFLIALKNTFEKHGIKNFDFYNSSIKKLSVDFTREEFPYTSSKWNDFSKKIIEDCFK